MTFATWTPREKKKKTTQKLKDHDFLKKKKFKKIEAQT